MSSEQLVLFDFGMNLTRLREAQERLLRCSTAKNTRRAYAAAWRCFEAWCAAAGRAAMPATEDTVCLYTTWCVDQGIMRLNTLRTRLSAIVDQHRTAGVASPVTSKARGLITCAAREKHEEPAGKLALSPEQLRRMAETLSSPRAVERRDRAMLVVGFALGWRGAEVAELQLSDVKFRGHQGLVVQLRFSKTDQEAKGHSAGIPPGLCAATCPVGTLRAWLDVRGSFPGPLFNRIAKGGTLVRRHGISRETVSDVVKRSLERIGERSADYASHSLRSGNITAGAENGADLAVIMQRTGHHDYRTVLRYVKPAQVFRRDPLAGVL
jgi:site-specific recombinase XerD